MPRTWPACGRPAEGPPTDLPTRYAEDLARLRATCEGLKEHTHAKTRALAVELLNDWDAIFQVLHHPALPLTNNEAERALRHWVILRKISHGTRTPTVALSPRRHRRPPRRTPLGPSAGSRYAGGVNGYAGSTRFHGLNGQSRDIADATTSLTPTVFVLEILRALYRLQAGDFGLFSPNSYHL